MDPLYRVWIHIDQDDDGEIENLTESTELASFHSIEEAQVFCSELQTHHTAQITGEARLLDEIYDPEHWTAGD